MSMPEPYLPLRKKAAKTRERTGIQCWVGDDCYLGTSNSGHVDDLLVWFHEDITDAAYFELFGMPRG